MNCKCCGAWFSSSDASQELCVACRKALARVSKLFDGIEPVRHGRWIPSYEEMEVFIDAYLNTTTKMVQTGWECSVCGMYSAIENKESMPYCHCGAKMDLEEE